MYPMAVSGISLLLNPRQETFLDDMIEEHCSYQGLNKKLCHAKLLDNLLIIKMSIFVNCLRIKFSIIALTAAG